MALAAMQPSHPLQRVAVPVRQQMIGPAADSDESDRAVMNFSNLARLAEIGLTARSFFGRDPILIIASRVSAADRSAADLGEARIRANTQGPYLLMDLPEPASEDAQREEDVQAFVATLVHELGHTPLGRYLADEYEDLAGGRVYRGPEPRPRNVTTHWILGRRKWSPWATDLDLLSGIAGRVGAYEHDGGILRLRDNCRMRTAMDLRGTGRMVEFCEVCREELTLGLLEHGHHAAGTPGTPGMVDLQIRVLAPWRDTASWRLHLEGGSTTRLEAFASPAAHGDETRVQLSVVGSSVPKDWEISWQVRHPVFGGSRTGPDVDLNIALGTSIDLTVRHNLLASGILSVTRWPPPETSVRLDFDQERRLDAAALTPPTDLMQSVPVGATLTPTVDPSGGLSLPQDLWLAARLGSVPGFDLPAGVEFQLEGPDGTHIPPEPFRSGRPGTQRRWLLDRMLPSGRYVWSARTTWRSLAGDWVQAPRDEADRCFTVAPFTFETEPRPPADPFNLEVVPTFTYPPVPAWLQASSWHPNDQPLGLRFQLRRQGEPWADVGETGPLTRDPANSGTLAVTGRVFVDLQPPSTGSEWYEWRVQAFDDQGQQSAWVEGRRFAVYLIDRRPRVVEELGEVLRNLDPRVLDPRGPQNLPLIFFTEEWPTTGRKADFTQLAKWQRSARTAAPRARRSAR
jgi:hypothetical protein